MTETADVKNTVSQAIWPWKEERLGPNDADDSSMGRRATVQAAIMFVIASLLFFWLEHRIMACVVYGLSTVVLVGGWFIPPIYLAIDSFGQCLGRIMSVALTWVLLTPFFYVCFTVGRLALLLRGKDPMRRECPSSETTYWNEHHEKRSTESYRKQY